MPVSKKNKHKNKKKNTNVIKPKKLKLIRYGANKTINCMTILNAPDLGGSAEKSNCILHVDNEPKTSTFMQSLQEDNIKLVHSKKDDILSQMQAISESEHTMKTYASAIENAFDQILNHVSELDQNLNIYNKTERSHYDTIDFSEFMKNDCETDDIIQQAMDIINTETQPIDPSWLWSTDEYFIIKITPSLSYACQRVLYDPLTNSPRYCCVEYRTIKTLDGKRITIPSLIFVVQLIAQTLDFDNMCHYTEPGCEWNIPDTCHLLKDMKLHENKAVPHNNLADAIFDGHIARHGRKFKCIRISIIGETTPFEMIEWMKNNKSEMNLTDQEYNLAKKAIPAIYYHDVFDSYQHADGEFVKRLHTLMATSIVSASLIIMNKRLKDKKLSRPMKETISNTTYKTGNVQVNEPERRTRLLGDTITITSANRPIASSMDRIIHFHTPEWGRREHLRRLKSGKTVVVKAAVCKRQCIAVNNISGQKSQGTDYKIKSNSD